MKKVSIIMLFMLFLGINTYSQTCTIQSLSNVPVGAVQVNVNMSGFSNSVQSFQFTVRYDSNYLHYYNVSDWFSGVSGVGVQNYYYAAGSTNVLTFVWGDTPVAVNGILCKLNFYYKGGATCTALDLTNGPTTWGVWDENDNAYTVSWVDGQVCGVLSDINDVSNESPSVKIYPTIANEKINVNYTIPENGKITLGLYNLMGDEIQKLTSPFTANSEYNQEMNVSELNSGIYFVRYQIETPSINTVKTEKITITR